jgi:hypothetical protein
LYTYCISFFADDSLHILSRTEQNTARKRNVNESESGQKTFKCIILQLEIKQVVDTDDNIINVPTGIENATRGL